MNGGIEIEIEDGGAMAMVREETMDYGYYILWSPRIIELEFGLFSIQVRVIREYFKEHGVLMLMRY